MNIFKEEEMAGVHCMQLLMEAILMSFLFSSNKYHCDPSTGDNDYVSCLHVASYKGHLDIALYLLNKCNINPDVSDNSYNTALLYAAMGGHCDLVTLVLIRNCNSSQCNKQGALYHY